MDLNNLKDNVIIKENFLSFNKCIQWLQRVPAPFLMDNENLDWKFNCMKKYIYHEKSVNELKIDAVLKPPSSPLRFFSAMASSSILLTMFLLCTSPTGSIMSSTDGISLFPPVFWLAWLPSVLSNSVPSVSTTHFYFLPSCSVLNPFYSFLTSCCILRALWLG